MTAIEFENVGNILEGFRLALEKDRAVESVSSLFRISSLILGGNCATLPSYGKRWSAFLAEMESFSASNRTPIVEFRASSDKADLAGSTVSVVENMIIQQASIHSNVASGLKYMIDECADNILEHSHSECGFISSNIEKENGIVEICIADRGITILGSYENNQDPDIKTDLEALQAANRGISTKNRPDAENRGYGLMTTQRMIVSGLGGAFAMISGSTIYVNDHKGRRFIDSASEMRIQGTIVAMRFKFNNADFRYIDYVE